MNFEVRKYSGFRTEDVIYMTGNVESKHFWVLGSWSVNLVTIPII
jgi:hypothetical protein